MSVVPKVASPSAPIFCLGLFLAAWVVGPAQAQVSGIYTCVDAQGRKLTSDRFIPECHDRVQKILNPSGTVKAELLPKLSALEQSQMDNKIKVEKAEQARLAEDKRRDRALLIRYPREETHQKERAEALSHIARVKQSAAGRVTQLLADRVKLDDELAFYKNDPGKAPPKLRRQMDESRETVAAQERFMADQDTEAQRVNARFDEELVRLKPLWQQAVKPTR